MSALSFSQSNWPPQARSPDGLGIVPLLVVGGVAASGYVASEVYGKQKASRKKRRAARSAAYRQVEEDRQRNVASYAQSVKRLEAMRLKVSAEVRDALRQTEVLARYAAKIGDAPDVQQFVAAIGGIQSAAGELAAALSEFEFVAPRGDEPTEFIVDVQPDIEADYKLLLALGREARFLRKRAEDMNWQASDLLKKIEQKKLAAELALRSKRARDLETAAREDAERRGRVEAQRDLVWETQLRERQDWIRSRRRSLSRGEADPGPWQPPVVEDVRSISPRVPQPGGDFASMCAGLPLPGGGGGGAWLCDPSNGWVNTGQVPEQSVNGLGGFFSEVFGLDKKKDKKQAKREQEHRIAAAEEEKLRRAKASIERGSASLKLTMREINNEATAAAGWVSRIRRMVADTPDLPARLVDDSVQKLNEWEQALSEVRIGVGEIDLGVEDPKVQQSSISELQAALATVRTVRIRASALKQTIESQVGLVNAHEIKLAALRDRQRELSVREKVLGRAEASSRQALDAERSATEKARVRRNEAEQQRILSSERQRVAELTRFLRQLERRDAIVARARGSFA